MKLLIVRHGVTIENDSHIAQGQTHGTLSEKGITENEELGRQLQEYYFNTIYSSPLNRALQTAQAIQRYNPHTHLVTDDRLMERHLGILQEQPYPIPYSEADLYEGMETAESMAARLTELLHEIKEKHPGETIVLVSHGYLIKVLLSLLHGRPVEEFPSITLMNNSSFSIEEVL
ncbi:MAG: histidine phosphatase family protein [Sphingobacteriales bacterium]|nr:histidine phosphatase family protein [Sphingobacteriales bacterium]